MAYSAVITRTVDWVPKTSAVTHIYEIVETDVDPTVTTEEYILENVPVVGTITLFTATWISGAGSASTLAPKAGLVSGWSASSQNEVFTRSAAAHHNDQDVVRYTAKDGKLYLNSLLGGGALAPATHVVHTRITIRAGHGG